MCGIAGHVAFDGAAKADREAVARMCALLAHRGPDAESVVELGPACLGHRRLSIIDLRPAAGQPMANEDGTVWLAANGEFYDFEPVRRDLAARGHALRSRSDSEIAIHLYEEMGPAFVEHLRGMFALALWDAANRRLVLARDRAGKKPLYYWSGPRGLVFASELRALVASGHFAAEVDPDAIDAYLALQYVPAPATVFRGVRKLEPGHAIVMTPGETPRPQPFSRLRYDSVDDRPVEEIAETLRSRIDDAVRARMISDVPLGAFLSGGIDSSVIVALMARHSSKRVRTFSIGFPSADSSELQFARLVASRYGTDHHEMVVAPDMVGIIPDLVRQYGEPFADCSAVPTWYLSRFTREHVTVALSGDGGDEAFGGYARYRSARVARALHGLPWPLPSLAASGLSSIAGPRLQPVRDFGRRLRSSETNRYLGLVGHFPHDDRLAIYSPEMRTRFAHDRVAARIDELLEGATARDPAGRLMELDVHTYLPGAILTKVDIASMAHSLEVRCPLLDQEVLGYAASIPSRLKLQGLKTKYIFRKAFADLLPKEILQRPKRGFDLPIDRWMRDDLAPMTRDLLLDRTARSRGWFDPAAVERLIGAHARGEPRGLQLWTLVVLEQWFRTFADGTGTRAQ